MTFDFDLDAISIAEVDDASLVAELVTKGGLHEFVKQFWEFAEPGRPFVDNWHIGAICEFLQAVLEGQVLRGLINVPPGATKTMTASVMMPAYQWSRDPAFKMLTGSFDQEIMLAAADKQLAVMRSDRYQLSFPESKLLNNDPAKRLIWTEKRGMRFCTSVRGKGTGWHGDLFLVDDCIKATDALRLKSKQNQEAIRWIQSTVESRRSDPKSYRVCGIMQRLASGDVSDYLLERGYEHLCLPMEYVPKASWIVGDWSAKLDPRTVEGELLFPARFDAETVASLKSGLGTDANIEAQLQQNPRKGRGGVIVEDWFAKTWANIPNTAYFVQIWDLNFKGNLDSHSMVVGNLFAVDGVDYYLVDEVRGMWNYPQARSQYIDAQKRTYWDRTISAVFEAKANGPALSADLQEMAANREIPPSVILPTLREPKQGDKFMRIVEQSGKIRAGRLQLPPEGGFPNLRGPDGWLPEITGFPFAPKDDRIDNLSMFLDYVSSGDVSLIAWSKYKGSDNDR